MEKNWYSFLQFEFENRIDIISPIYSYHFTFFRVIKVQILNTHINTLDKIFMITDSQIYIALVIAAVGSILAIRLGSTLYS